SPRIYSGRRAANTSTTCYAVRAAGVCPRSISRNLSAFRSPGKTTNQTNSALTEKGRGIPQLRKNVLCSINGRECSASKKRAPRISPASRRVAGAPPESAQGPGGFRACRIRKDHREDSVAEPFSAAPHQRPVVCLAKPAFTANRFDG